MGREAGRVPNTFGPLNPRLNISHVIQIDKNLDSFRRLCGKLCKFCEGRMPVRSEKFRNIKG